jgi:hypothetical protein
LETITQTYKILQYTYIYISLTEHNKQHKNKQIRKHARGDEFSIIKCPDFSKAQKALRFPALQSGKWTGRMFLGGK